jgi:hypothetical protein
MVIPFSGSARGFRVHGSGLVVAAQDARDMPSKTTERGPIGKTYTTVNSTDGYGVQLNIH